MSLTAQEKANITSQWKSLMPDKEAKIQAGIILFTKIFEKYPEYQKLFKSFKDITSLEQLKTAPQMRAHGLRFMNALDGCVESLDEPEALCTLLDGLAEGHKLRNVTRDHFEKTTVILKDMVLEVLGDKADKQAWEKFFGFAESQIMKTYQ